MRILILGGHGLLGSALEPVLSVRHEVTALGHKECDIVNPNEVASAVKKTRPDAIINCAAYTNVDAAETHEKDAYELNAKGVGVLVSEAKRIGFTLIHFSTDYIFDGTSMAGYKEDALPSPLSVYGASKAAGEVHIKELEKFFLIRSSWLFGPNGKNFVDTMLTQLEMGKKELNVVNDQRGCPTYTLDLAQAVMYLLEGKNYGIYHCVNSGEATWYELALEIFSQLGVALKISPITTKDLNRPASRPPHSVLISTKGPKLRHWKDALSDYLQSKQLII